MKSVGPTKIKIWLQDWRENLNLRKDALKFGYVCTFSVDRYVCPGLMSYSYGKRTRAQKLDMFGIRVRYVDTKHVQIYTWILCQSFLWTHHLQEGP